MAALTEKGAASLALALGLWGCVAADDGGAAERGRRLMAHYQCTACHRVPGVPGPQGSFGPSLEGFGLRIYIAGQWPNDAQHVAAWIVAPSAWVPDTPMPALGVAPADARDIAAFLTRLETQ